MLSILEEVVLLAVDEKTGRLRTHQGYTTGYALAGAVFFDMALAKRIDTGADEIQLIDSSPTGNSVTDSMVTEIARHPELKTVRAWILQLARSSEKLEEAAIASLVQRGILRHEHSRRLWIIDVERYPLIDNKPQQEAKMRLAHAILTDEIPETRDIMLVSLAQACGLLEYVLSRQELDNRKARVELLCNIECISRAVVEAIGVLESNIHMAMNS